jgi:ketosteroid isomerase-like protein
MAHDERAISELLDALTHALFTKDATSAIAPLADDAVTFDLAPPLQHGPEITHDPARLEDWFRTWKGPIISEPGERTIVVDENVAYAYGLQRMTGTKTDGEKVELWFRATACFRRNNGQWRITHMHNSVPFAMDGSDKALLDLKP